MKQIHVKSIRSVLKTSFLSSWGVHVAVGSKRWYPSNDSWGGVTPARCSCPTSIEALDDWESSRTSWALMVPLL